MKLSISFQAPDSQSLNEVDNEYKLILNKLRATKVAAGALGEEWKGYVVEISGGSKNHSFPKKKCKLIHDRGYLLFRGMAPIGCVGLPQDCDTQPHNKPKESK